MNASSVILISFFTSVVTSGATLYLSSRLMPMEAPAAEKKESVVPSLLGLSETDARVTLTASKLVLIVQGKEPAADATPDTVIKQSIPAGTRVPVDQLVTVTLAEALPSVPDVTGKALAEATTALEQSGYVVQVAPAQSDKTASLGVVLSQLPKASAQLAKSKTVTITPSAGPEAQELPKLTGLTLGSAKIILQKAGFKLGKVSWVALAERTGYLVVGQTPKAGEEAEPGSAINLVVNRGD